MADKNYIIENLKKQIEDFQFTISSEKVGKVLEVFDGPPTVPKERCKEQAEQSTTVDFSLPSSTCLLREGAGVPGPRLFFQGNR